MSGSFTKTAKWKALRLTVLERDAYTCRYCGMEPSDHTLLHADHVLPASMYPELQWEIDNLVTACRRCNLKKGASTVKRCTWVDPKYLAVVGGTTTDQQFIRSNTQ